MCGLQGYMSKRPHQYYRPFLTYPTLRAATGRGDHQSPLDAAMSRPNTGECIVSGYLHVAPSFARSAVLLSVIGCRKQFLCLDVGRFVTPRFPRGLPTGSCFYALDVGRGLVT